MTASTPQKLLAEGLGTALLLAVVIGSGIMAERLAGGNVAIALLANTLATVGGLYVLVTISVILQVGSYQLTGKRIFRMAPIHHHFELAGWPETTIIIRFWILAGMSTAIALGTYYADFIRTTGVGRAVSG